METSNMKNIVVLKNLPSNLVDEAIVILKSNKNAKKLEYVERTTNSGYSESANKKDYVVKEAELVISNYISKIEKNNKKTVQKTSIEKKYKKIKIYSIIISVLLLFVAIHSF